MTNGYVYVLGSKVIPAYKICFTKRTPEKRAKKLSKIASSPSRLYFFYATQHSQAKDLEALVHGRLKKKRFGREFYKTNLFQAIETITTCSNKYSHESLNLYSEIKKTLEFTRDLHDRIRKPLGGSSGLKKLDKTLT